MRNKFTIFAASVAVDVTVTVVVMAIVVIVFLLHFIVVIITDWLSNTYINQKT